MIPSLSVKGHRCVASAYARQGKTMHLLSIVGVRESVRAALAAMQHGHSAVLKAEETTLVNLGYQSIKVIQGRLPNGAFHAVAIGESIAQGDILIVKPGTSLAERFYHYLTQKSTLPLHSSWQDKLLELAQDNEALRQLDAYGVQGYSLEQDIESIETLIRYALLRGELPEIGETACA